MGDGTFVITGLQAGANVAFNSLGGADYNAIAITSAARAQRDNPGRRHVRRCEHFAIGVFGFFTASAGDPIDLSFDVTATELRRGYLDRHD